MKWLSLASAAMMPMRPVLLALAVLNMAWSLPGVCATFRGRRRVLSMVQSTIFFLAAGTAAYQAFAVFSTPNAATRLGSSVTLLVGLSAALAVRSTVKRLSRIERVFLFTEGALAIADLWAVDRVAAEAMATAARRQTAEAMIRG